MNNVTLIGRLTREPELRYTPQQLAVATFSLAIDCGRDNKGESKGTDFPRITVFGKQAENCEKFLAKGLLAAVQGRLQTGSYKNKNGDTVYTMDVIADRIEFLQWKSQKEAEPDNQRNFNDEEMPDSFKQIDEDIPF